MPTGITEITHFTTKQCMSRWTRAHADSPGITWSVYPGPGGTMIIVEHEGDRSSLGAAKSDADVAAETAAAQTGASAAGDTISLAASA